MWGRIGKSRSCVLDPNSAMNWKGYRGSGFVAIPVLSIQPLVENAIKHGVAARAGAGFVRVRIESESELHRGADHQLRRMETTGRE